MTVEKNPLLEFCGAVPSHLESIVWGRVGSIPVLTKRGRRARGNLDGWIDVTYATIPDGEGMVSVTVRFRICTVGSHKWTWIDPFSECDVDLWGESVHLNPVSCVYSPKKSSGSTAVRSEPSAGTRAEYGSPDDGSPPVGGG